MKAEGYRLKWGDWGIVAAAMACLACLALACFTPILLAASTEAVEHTGLAHVMPLCVWARGGNVGLWWNAFVAPRGGFTYSKRHNAVCLAMLWSPSLPSRGRPSVDMTP